MIVYIGKAMFLQNHQESEIKRELAEKNIPICESEVGYLAKKFIIYLSTLQNSRSNRLYEILENNGGYILHLDALGEKGCLRLISGIDSISEFVLDNEKIISEKKDYIVPFLERIKSRYGNPLAVVQDMGKGIMNAVETVFFGIKIFICHFHFLRDIGKDLLNKDYDIIRKRLRSYGILSKLRSLAKPLKAVIEQHPEEVSIFSNIIGKEEKIDLNSEIMQTISVYFLIQWILSWKTESKGYGFPFDRPHLSLSVRLSEGYVQIDKIKNRITDCSTNISKTITKLKDKLKLIVDDIELQNSAQNIQEDIKIFDNLREAMQIAPNNSNDGLNFDGVSEDLKTIEQRVRIFRKNLLSNDKLKTSKEYQKFLVQINKYWDKLFADPIEVISSEGNKVIQPQRTNNIMERFFRDFRHSNMRKTGNSSMKKTLKSMIKDTPLARNLKNKKFMDAILNENELLEEAFAQINPESIRLKIENERRYIDSIPKNIKILLKKNKLPMFI
ncbi:MAG: transposase [Candidatus Thermoplasmatota archaeon]|nr:transposase [Candidatus Thermoplasmatota archaeon]